MCNKGDQYQCLSLYCYYWIGSTNLVAIVIIVSNL